MRRLLDRISRFPTYISKGLLVHKALVLLKSVGIVVEPYYFYQEGPFRDIPTRGMEDFEFTEVGVVDVPSMAELYEPPLTVESLRGQFAAGRKCFALKHGDGIAAFTWCDTSVIQFRPCSRPLGAHEAYLYGAQTRFEFRGRKLQPFLRRKCYEALMAGGRYLMYSYSDYFNYPAIHFKEKLGGRILFTGLNIELFGIWKTHRTIKKIAEVVDPRPPGSGGGERIDSGSTF